MEEDHAPCRVGQEHGIGLGATEQRDAQWLCAERNEASSIYYCVLRSTLNQEEFHLVERWYAVS